MIDFWKMILAAMLLNLVIAFIAPLMAIFVQEIGEKSLISVGYAYGASFIIQGLTSFYFGKLSDRFGTKKFLVLGNILICFVPFGYLFASNIYQVISLQILMGLGLSMGNPSYFSLFTEKTKGGTKGFGFGIFLSTINIIIGIGALIGTSIVEFLGFRSLFIVMGVVQVTQTILISTVKEK